MKQFLLSIIFITHTFLIRGQLNIGAGINWKSSGNTFVVLQDLGLKYDATPTLLENTFRLSGTSDVTITGSTLPIFSTIQLNKSGASKLILGRAIQANLVDFQSGLFELNNFYVDLGTTGSINGENEASRFTGANGGYVQIVNTLNAPTLANPGNLGAIISTTQNLGTVTIRRGHRSQTNPSGGGNSILRYYDISPENNTGLNATLRFFYFDAELNGLPESSLQFWKSLNNTQWTNEGFTSRDATMNYVEKTGISSFSRWTLSTPGNPLPVTGLVLTGSWRNNAAYLDWKTFTEYNNSHFDIERKYANESFFNSIGLKNSAHPGGNSFALTFYKWVDRPDAALGLIQYRLKQVDRDGRFNYSNTIVLTPQLSTEFIITVYPSMGVKEKIFIQTGYKNLKEMVVRLYDLGGRLCLQKHLSYHSQWLNIPMLANGMYNLKISSGEWEYNSRLFKE